MEMFTRIADLIGKHKCSVTINVMSIGTEELTVSLNYRDNDCKDDAANLIAPFCVKATPAELDAEFASKIGALKASVDAQDEMKAYMDSIEAAKKASKKATDTKAAKTAAKPAAKTKAEDTGEEEAEAEAPAENTALKKAVEKATKLQDSKKYPQAIKAFEEALALVPEEDEAARSIIQENLADCKAAQEKDEFEKIDVKAEWEKASGFMKLGDYNSVLAIITRCYPKATDSQKAFFDKKRKFCEDQLSQASIFA